LIALVFTGLAVAGVIKGATGLGYASSALPFLVYAVGLKAAIGLVLLPAMITNVAVALGNGYLQETWRAFSRLYVAMLPGIAVGYALLHSADVRVAVLCLGVSVVVYSLFSLSHPDWHLDGSVAARLQLPAGFVNGVLTGLTGSQVMPLVPYMMAVGLDGSRTVQAINLGVLIASAVLLATLAVAGSLSTPLLTVSALSCLPALGGVEIGRRVRTLIPERAVRRAILVVLLFSGFGMLVR